MPKPRTSTGEKNLISKRLIKLREKHNMSQRLLAYQLQLNGYDMDKNVITRIETNKRYHLVDITEPICQRIDSNLASMSIFDTSGIEAWVTENNPKYANRIIKQLKAFAKAHNFDKNFDPYKAAYGSMPAHATANPAIQQMYINGHFCYAYKFGIVTNGLGIVRDITFYNKDFLSFMNYCNCMNLCPMCRAQPKKRLKTIIRNIYHNLIRIKSI